MDQHLDQSRFKTKSPRLAGAKIRDIGDNAFSHTFQDLFYKFMLLSSLLKAGSTVKNLGVLTSNLLFFE